MTEVVDLINRDPNNLNDNLRVTFEEVLGEPDHTHSADCVWTNSYKCFTCSKNCCYKFLTFICGIPMALCWGCEFACLSFYQIWECTPSLRTYMICCATCQKFFGTAINCCMAPVCEACGLFFSNIRVTNK